MTKILVAVPAALVPVTLISKVLLHFMTSHSPTSQTTSHSEAVKLSVYMRSPAKPARSYHGKIPLPRRKIPMTTVVDSTIKLRAQFR